jgi:tetratricopeptide (TPR) repeat protein
MCRPESPAQGHTPFEGWNSIMLKGVPLVARLKITRQFRLGRIREILLGILAWAVACYVLAQTAAKQPQAPQPSEPIAIAADAPGQASLVAMEAELRRNLELHPDAAPTLYRLGLVLRQEGKPKESLETYTQAARVQKPDAEELRSVALDYVLLDDYPDAIHWLETAVSLDSSNVEVLYSLARCLYTQGQYHKAETLYLRVLQIKPDYLKAEENLGLAYDAENQSEAAEKALRTAADWGAKQTSDEWPFLNLGAFLLDHDRPVEAVPFLEKATAIAPKSSLCHEKLGRALEQSGRQPNGVAELETAVQLDPKNPNIHFELGHAYRLAGALEKARVEFAVSQQLRQERDRK